MKAIMIAATMVLAASTAHAANSCSDYLYKDGFSTRARSECADMDRPHIEASLWIYLDGMKHIDIDKWKKSCLAITDDQKLREYIQNGSDAFDRMVKEKGREDGCLDLYNKFIEHEKGKK
jgi:hypothetical protein